MMAALSVSRLVTADAEQRSRWLTIVITAIAACIALTGANILTLGALAHALIGGSVFAPLALGLWWPRATGAGALAGIIGGALVVAAAVFWGSTGIDLLSAGAIGLVVSLVLTIVVSLLSDPASSVPGDTQRRIGLTKDPEAPE
jgi:Na+/proline symporter